MTDLFTFVQQWCFCPCSFRHSLHYTKHTSRGHFFLSQPHTDHKAHSCLYHIYVYSLKEQMMDIFQFGILPQKQRVQLWPTSRCICFQSLGNDTSRQNWFGMFLMNHTLLKQVWPILA